MLAMHPDYQEKIFDELSTIFQHQNSPVSAEDLHKMEYGDRFIKETLRLFPVVPLASRSATKDVQMGTST